MGKSVTFNDVICGNCHKVQTSLGPPQLVKSAFDEFTSLATVGLNQTSDFTDSALECRKITNKEEKRFSRLMLEFFSFLVCDRYPLRQVLECLWSRGGGRPCDCIPEPDLGPTLRSDPPRPEICQAKGLFYVS